MKLNRVTVIHGQKIPDSTGEGKHISLNCMQVVCTAEVSGACHVTSKAP